MYVHTYVPQGPYLLRCTYLRVPCGAYFTLCGLMWLDCLEVAINSLPLYSQLQVQYCLLDMAPIRRYLRITKHSAIECRIYLENPALAESWLLHPRHNVLPRVIQSIQPLVLPKLREERERARKKSGAAKKSIKDLVVQGRRILVLTLIFRCVLY